MSAARVVLALLLSFVLFAANATAVNEVRLFVPADEFHAEGELLVGVPGYVYVEVSNDVEVNAVNVSFAFTGSAGIDPFGSGDVEYLLSETILVERFSNIGSDGSLPDTINTTAFQLVSGSTLSAGTTNFFRIRVTPTAEGTITLAGENHHLNGPTRFGTPDDGDIFPEILGAEIAVIGPVDCNDNGVVDDQDLAAGTSTDCNVNGIPDECEVAAGNTPACVFNEVRAYVPGDQYHGEGQLKVGIPGYIYFEIANDVELSAAAISCALSGTAGVQPFGGADLEILLPEGQLSNDLTWSKSDGVLPDSSGGIAIKMAADLPLYAGRRTFARLQVTPTASGTITVDNVVHPQNGPSKYLPTGGGELYPSFVATEITVIGSDDCNENGVPDLQDLLTGTSQDCNDNGFPDECDIAWGTAADCNANGVPDECDLATFSDDCNGNGIPDECETDLNFNGIPDDCEPGNDCNYNGVADELDIITGFSTDSNSNGVPDECEGLAGNFFRIYNTPNGFHGGQELVMGQSGDIIIGVANDVEIMGAVLPFRFSSDDGTPLWDPLTLDNYELLVEATFSTLGVVRQGGDWPDSLLILPVFGPEFSLEPGFHPIVRLTVVPTAAGTVTWETAPMPLLFEPANFILDMDGNSFEVGLEAEPLTVLADLDCNGNEIPDSEELEGHDCNGNGFLDECDIASGFAEDCNENGIPDECDTDLNENGIPDDCESTGDCNGNGINDIADIAGGWSTDTNANGVPDECEGLEGNYLKIYLSPDLHPDGGPAEAHAPLKMIWALVNDEPIDAAVVPVRFSSGDGTLLWETITEDNFEFLLPSPGGSSQQLSVRAGENWPDTVSVLQVLFDGGALPVGCHPFVQMTVEPVAAGTVNWEFAPVPSTFHPAAYAPDDGGALIEIGLEAEPLEIIPAYDCNANGISDLEEIATHAYLDCNHNQFLDECEIARGEVEDCNANGKPDECDYDLNMNGIPDDCEEVFDCNANGVSDAEDIATGYSADVNDNGVPDECEGLAGNYILVFTTHQELYVGRAGEIYIAAVTDTPLDGYVLPLRYLSGDGTPLWEPVTGDDLEFIDPGPQILFQTERQNGTWPDTLLAADFLVHNYPLPAGFNLVAKLTVNPTAVGEATFEAAPIPPTLQPPQFIFEDLSEAVVPVVAEPLVVRAGCCFGRVGDINLSGNDEPTIGDISLLIDHLFISGVALQCVPEADVNQSGGADPEYSDLSIGDISALVAYLYLNDGDLPLCFQ